MSNKRIELEQKTFGKKTRSLIAKLVPTARKAVKIEGNFLIKDENNNTVATWLAGAWEAGKRKPAKLIIK